MELLSQTLQVSFYYLLPFIVLESLLKAFYSKTEKVSIQESATNILMALMGRVLRKLFTGQILISILYVVKPYAFFSLPNSFLFFGITIIVADFIYYWEHRISHKIRCLWVFHSVHHSSEEFNLSTAIRFPWFGRAVNSIFYIPFVLFGFDPLSLVLAQSLNLFYQFWVHTQSIPRLGILEYILNTPSNHRVHHGKNDMYIDKNFGGIFIFWDLMFRSYQVENEKVVFGVLKPVYSNNPFVVNLYEPYHLLKDLIKRKGFRAKINALFSY